MAVYTKKGDRGTTSLYGGVTRRKKYDIRINAYGTVDELNSSIGLVSSFLTNRSKRVKSILNQVQTDLFEIASELATDPKTKKPFSLDTKRIKYLEQIIDELEGSLPPLQNFIFSGGSKPGALLHLARTVCRRAERIVVQLANKEK